MNSPRFVSFRRHEWLADSWLVIPGAYVIAAVVVGIVLPQLDALGFEPFSLTVTSDTASTILSTTAGGMITFTGLVVSVTVVVVQFGAGQYTPRLVRHFQRDPLVKHAVGIFVAPAIYAIVSLRSITPSPAPVRSAVITICILLLIAAMFAFFVLIRRMLDLLRPRRLYTQLTERCEEAVLEVYPRTLADGGGHEGRDAELAPNRGLVHHRRRSGVLSAIDIAELADAADRADCTIELLWPIGSHVSRGSPLYRLRANGPVNIDREKLSKAFSIPEERTVTQDPLFAIRAIVDIGLRALSPAVNDPTTGVQALDVLEEILHLVAVRDLDDGRVISTDGRLLVVFPVASWNDFIDLALTEIRIYGQTAPQITRRLYALLLGLRSLAPERRQDAVDRHLALLGASLERAFSDPVEREFAAEPDHTGIGGRLPSFD